MSSAKGAASLPGVEYPLKYRADIDGLRALAVLSVVFYHLDLPLRGGYVGVDIFFTISGYLIGSIILRQTAEGVFTFAGFYERRFRRIFPALFVMMLASTLLAYRYLLPGELVSYSKSLIAAAFSVSNIYFWSQSGYFDAPASDTPLLHTWSLAIEEQFYVFLPILLVLLHRYASRRINAVIALVGIGSFLLSIYGEFHDPSTTFYLLHTRAWELLLGSSLALQGFPKLRGALARQGAAIVGMLLIAAALLFYRTWTPFPGLAALPPCLGTALIIAAGESGTNVAGRLLSLKPVVFVGLISYSLYLWHWPIIVFHKFGLTLLEGLDRHQTQALMLAVCFVLAVLSWRFVEVPIRRGASALGRRTLFGGTAVATGLTAAASIALIVFAGVPDRFPEQARRVADYIDDDPSVRDQQVRLGTCLISAETATLQSFARDRCLPDLPGRKKLLIFGDSHAAAMWWGLDQTLRNVNVMQATATGCKPVLHQRPRQHAGCTEIVNYMLKDYLPSHKVDAVLLEAHWDEEDLANLGETLAWLKQHGVVTILFGPVVQYDEALPRLLAMSISDNDPSLPRRHLQRFAEPLDERMAALARDTWQVPYASWFEMLCPNQSCVEYGAPGAPLQYDYSHLSKTGSVLAARKILALGVLPHDLAPDTGSPDIASQ